MNRSRPELRVVGKSAGADLQERLTTALYFLKIKLEERTLSSLKDWDIKRTVIYIGGKTNQPLCIVPQSCVGRLLGNEKLRQLPMTWSCMRVAGKSLRPILNCGAIDSLAISYAVDDDFAVIVDAGRLLEHLQR